MMIPIVVTAPTVEPLSLSDIKAHCRINHTADDSILQNIYLPAARAAVEGLMDRTFHQTTLRVAMDDFPVDSIELPRSTPLIEVDHIKYRDSTGTWNTVSAALYVVDIKAEIGSVAPAYGQSWPSFTAYPVSPVEIQYKAGISNASPQTYPVASLTYPILRLIAAMYENREEEMLVDIGQAQITAWQYGMRLFAHLGAAKYGF